MNEWMDGYLDMGLGTAIENGRLALRFEYTGALTPDRAGGLYICTYGLPTVLYDDG